MKISALKDRIGSQAQDIIVSGLNLEKQGGAYECPYRDHKKGKSFSALWYDDGLHFHCHDCGRMFDISDYAALQGDRMQSLHRLANIDYRPLRIETIQPIASCLSAPGIEYLKSRKISQATAKLYLLTSDDRWLYFNYYLPGNGGLVKIKQRVIGDCRNGDNKYSAPPGGTNVLYGLHLLQNQKFLLICEGEIDCLSMHECLVLADKAGDILAVSIPAGSKSFGWIDTCRQWLDQFDGIILVPDSDQSGQEFLTKATELLAEYMLFHIALPMKDVNDYLLSPKYNPAEIFKLSKPVMPLLKGIKKSTDVGAVVQVKAISTGYLTQDFNDGGFKMGCLSLYTGRRGDGKTTYTRQFLISIAKQGYTSFMFCGESTIAHEKDKLARLYAGSDDIIKAQNIGGRDEYSASAAARQKYDAEFGDRILLSDNATMEKEFTALAQDQKQLFPLLLGQMKNLARHHKVKVFILDNLMVFCSNSGNAKFGMQESIVSTLKAFVNSHQVHCCLIAHPKAGDGYQKISGAMEIENIADSIFRYVRIDDGKRNSILKDVKLPDDIKRRISAMVITEKVRDDGARQTAFLEWDAQKGAVYNLSTSTKAGEYEAKGYWTKSINKYPEQSACQTTKTSIPDAEVLPGAVPTDVAEPVHQTNSTRVEITI